MSSERLQATLPRSICRKMKLVPQSSTLLIAGDIRMVAKNLPHPSTSETDTAAGISKYSHRRLGPRVSAHHVLPA